VAEVDRTVNLVGYIGLGGDRCTIGRAFAGQRVTLRLDGSVMQVLDRLRPGALPTIPPPAGRIAEQTVSSSGGFVVAGQRIQMGRAYARQVVTAHLDDGRSSRTDVKQHQTPNRQASPETRHVT
jgi:hypothetical protein